MERYRAPKWLWICLGISSLVAFGIGIVRYRMEARAKAVHLAAPIEEIELCAALSGVSFTDALQRLKSAGLTAVVVSEETFESLEESGEIVPTVKPKRGFLVHDKELFERIKTLYGGLQQTKSQSHTLFFDESGTEISLPVSLNEILVYGVGFDKTICRTIQNSGLALIVRVGNPPVNSDRMIRAILGEMQSVKAQGVIFQQDQVLGWRDQAEFAASALQKAGIWYGSVEFANQAGDRVYLRVAPENVLRVHSVLPAEMTQNEISTIKERYVRAATERNIRVCYLRPPGNSKESSLAGFGSFISNIRDSLRAEGYDAKNPNSVRSPEIPTLFRFVLALGTALLAIWLVEVLLPHTPWKALIALVILVITLSIWFSPFALKISALIAAISFPTWAMLEGFARISSGEKRYWSLFYIGISLISIFGGLHVAGMLTSLPFMIKADQFLGVKLAHILPPVIIGSVFLFRQVPMRSLLGKEVRWLDIAVIIVLLLALIILVVRTGNESPTAVSSWELRAREILDQILPERPRTKEIFLGNPALVLGLIFALRSEWRFVPLLGFAAAIGQASIVNTFCHLHTPIEVSVVRTLVGLFVGAIIGLILWGIIRPQFREHRTSN
ncbi:MAG TPA: DUF5693 family protein [Fimbriimonadales bacterium]|nr:DUF5693 family protein [Fimbriimonadales bacterium]